MNRLNFGLLLVVILVTAGCSNCDHDFIDAEMPALVAVSGNSRSLTLFDSITDSDPDGSFPPILRAIENASVDPGFTELVVLLTQGLQPIAIPSGFSFALRMPVQQGETIAVDTSAFLAEDWAIGNGQFGTSPAQPFKAGIRIGDFVADRVRGTVEVVDTTRLRLRMSLHFSQTGNSTTVDLSGEIDFQKDTRPDLCD